MWMGFKGYGRAVILKLLAIRAQLSLGFSVKPKGSGPFNRRRSHLDLDLLSRIRFGVHLTPNTYAGPPEQVIGLNLS